MKALDLPAMAAELMIGFWFDTGFILAIRMVNILDYCVIVLKNLSTEDKVTTSKMAKQQVTTKDPKKVKAGKRLAEHSCRKREEHAQLVKAQSESNITYYGIGAVVATGVLGVISYYVYQSKTPKETPVHQTNETPVQQAKETPDNKVEMD